MKDTMKPIRVPLSFPAKWLEVQVILIYLVPLPLVILCGVLNAPAWMLCVFAFAWLAAFCGLLATPFLCDYLLFPEGIQFRVYGKAIRQIPVEEIKHT